MAGAALGEVQVSLFVAGVALGEVQVSLFVAGAALGEVQASLFRGRCSTEFLNVSRGAKCCIFQYKMLVVSAKSNLGCEAGCRLTVSCSDHSRIVPALEITFHLFANIFSEILQRHFACQAQYLVRLDHGTCCSAHCK